jgi:undecaprenyl-diphosphatase
MTWLQALILGIVEGLTEFLPISSTGHMILASAAMGMQETEFLKTFEISIQLGAILAIALMYIKRFFQSFDIYIKLIISFIPTVVIGFLMYDFVKSMFSPLVVSISLVLGGVILIFVDKKVENKKTTVDDVSKIPIKNALFIGLIQCISMIPGVSRAGATIVGGVFNGFDKKQATEYSFLLAVPTMIAASSYDLLKSDFAFTSDQLMILLLGLIVAFASAWGAVKLFLVIVEKFGFKYFGWYRIGIGLLFLILILTKII